MRKSREIMRKSCVKFHAIAHADAEVRVVDSGRWRSRIKPIGSARAPQEAGEAKR